MGCNQGPLVANGKSTWRAACVAKAPGCCTSSQALRGACICLDCPAAQACAALLQKHAPHWQSCMYLLLVWIALEGFLMLERFLLLPLVKSAVGSA
jgi:hypothetical protein